MVTITKIRNKQENLGQLQCHKMLLYYFNLKLKTVMEGSLGSFAVIFNNFYSVL